MEKLRGLATTVEEVFDMCSKGMVATDADGEGLVLKPTRVITNSAVVQEHMRGRCSGDHRHVNLANGRASAAAEYPVTLCDGFIDAAVITLAAAKESQPEWLGSLRHQDLF